MFTELEFVLPLLLCCTGLLVGITDMLDLLLPFSRPPPADETATPPPPVDPDDDEDEGGRCICQEEMSYLESECFDCLHGIIIMYIHNKKLM